MPQIVVGLLTAVGTAMSVAASLAHGDLFWAAAIDAAAATGLAAYLALSPTKKSPSRLELVDPNAAQLALLCSSGTLAARASPCAASLYHLETGGQ